MFLTINHRSDGAAADMVLRMLGQDACVLRTPLETELMLGLFSRMQAIVSMRLHGLIFAAGQGVPLVGVVYDPKVSSFLSYMGQDLYEDLSDVTEDSLRQKLDRALALRQDRTALEQAVSRLRQLEEHNSAAMRKLLSET